MSCDARGCFAQAHDPPASVCERLALSPSRATFGRSLFLWIVLLDTMRMAMLYTHRAAVVPRRSCAVSASLLVLLLLC